LPTSATSPQNRPVAAIVLAAGEGKRMKSSRTKVLHPVAGRTMAEHVTRAALGAGASPVVVVTGAQAEDVEAALRRSLPDAEKALRFVRQTERLGTADAVLRAREALGKLDGDVLILCGDVPALEAKAVKGLLAHHRRQRAALTVLTAEPEDATGYGRILRDAGGRIERIIEHRDATKEQRRIREINTGTYCADWRALRQALEKIRPDNDQGEYYLTDAVRLLLDDGKPVSARTHPDAAEALGVNSRRQLAQVHAAMNARILDRLMDGGVTVLDPASTWVAAGVKVGADTVLHPGVQLEGSTRVGKACEIRAGVRLTDTTVKDGATILDHSVLVGSAVGKRTQVGPFAHLRVGTRLGDDCKVGNFVETKKAAFGPGSKASHLSYLGDAVIGKKVNIGAGTITCNYDGVNKHVTKMGDGVFIGSDTQLVAPVTLGRKAYVGAGSTVTKDVPAGALTLTRAEQRIIDGWVARKEQKRKQATRAGGEGGDRRAAKTRKR
jgi:bifunctional UDP-N-acetylglucosamine pyrophosphorylase/glucosamine-1-phosphate N-acetyltransferase